MLIAGLLPSWTPNELKKKTVLLSNHLVGYIRIILEHKIELNHSKSLKNNPLKELIHCLTQQVIH